MVKLICPACGAEFLKTNRNSKSCSYDCSHQLVKRKPMFGRHGNGTAQGAAVAQRIQFERALAQIMEAL